MQFSLLIINSPKDCRGRFSPQSQKQGHMRANGFAAEKP
ncbi:hypothetical protein IMSAGC013_01241 [Lachnospiraceae bacterium]|nr:hypothetical protein IMSAGC013_01241 [Lachnospiraceae bacterium]